jgi:hypothetical protein
VTTVRSDEGWDLVPEHVRRAIDRRFGGSQPHAAAAAKVDTRTIDKLLAGKPGYRRPSLVRLATAFGWEPDDFDTIRAGGQPSGAAEEVDDVDSRFSRIEATLTAQGEKLARLERLVRGDE